jgi:molybdopterin-guanine dinucleotide biosynthesis protein B
VVPPPRPVLLSLLGPSGAGKTSLAVVLVRRWTAAGLRVGYLKHASHGFQMDRPGKDSDRATAAGAAGVAVTGPGGFAYVERGESAEPEAILGRWFADRDVVVLEGFRTHGFPAVVLAGGQTASAAVAEARGPVLAVVIGRDGIEAARAAWGGAPVFAPDDLDGLAAHLEVALGVSVRATSSEEAPRRARRRPGGTAN